MRLSRFTWLLLLTSIPMPGYGDAALPMFEPDAGQRIQQFLNQDTGNPYVQVGKRKIAQSVYHSAYQKGSATVVLSRTFPANPPQLSVVERGKLIACPTPEIEPTFLWRGVGFNQETKSGWFVIYNVASRRNSALPFSHERRCPRIDVSAAQELRFKARYQINGRVFLAQLEDTWHLAMGGSWLSHDGEQWVEIRSDRNSHWLDVNPVRRIAVATNGYDLPADSVPPVRIHDIPNFKSPAFTFTAQNVRAMFGSLDGSGSMNFGMNNAEGRISWDQHYYLSAFLDLLEFPDYFAQIYQQHPDVVAAMQARLHLEMSALQSLVCEPGLLAYQTPRYALNREPFHAIVNIGRLAELFGRYQVVTGSEVASRCWDELIPALLRLENTWEEFAKTAFAGQAYQTIRRRRDVAFARDGVNLPFNHISAWLIGLHWAVETGRVQPKDLPEAVIQDHFRAWLAASGIDNARKHKRYSWKYTWSDGHDGWQETDDVSTNARSWRGTQSDASRGYLSMDTEAWLAHHTDKHHPQLVAYFQTGIASGGLSPTVQAWMLRRGTPVDLELQLASLYPATPAQFRDALWMLPHYLRTATPGANQAVIQPASNCTRPGRVLKVEPSERLAPSELWTMDRCLPDTLRLAVFDAHIDRGSWQLGSEPLPARKWHILTLDQLASLRFHSAEERGRYDDVRLRIFDGVQWHAPVERRVDVRKYPAPSQ